MCTNLRLNVMNLQNLSIAYSEYESIEELDYTYKMLLEEASKAMYLAYAPYSGFSVGAAVLLQNEAIVTGNNQENAAYPSGLCAERVAVFHAAAQYPGIPMKAVAITAMSDKFEVNFPVSPCGSCRQVLAEYEQSRKSPIRVILKGASGKIIVFNKVADLLPFVFGADQLHK